MTNNQAPQDITSNNALKNEHIALPKSKKFLFSLTFSVIFFFAFIFLTGKTAIWHIIIAFAFSLLSAVISIFMPSNKKRYYISLGLACSLLLLFITSLMAR